MKRVVQIFDTHSSPLRAGSSIARSRFRIDDAADEVYPAQRGA